MNEQYVITDGRELSRAWVCEVCTTKREALRERPFYGADAKVYRIPPGDSSEKNWERVR